VNEERVQFSKEDKDFFASSRAADPAVDQLFKDVRSLMKQFTGSHLTYLQVGGREWGAKSEWGVLPNIPTPIPASKRAPKPTTQNAKRRALTKYKE